MSLKFALELMQNDDLDGAIQIFNSSIKQDCLKLISKFARKSNVTGVVEIYYDAFIEFANEVKDKKFVYVSENKTSSFFKQKCKLKSYDENKKNDQLISHSENFMNQIIEDDNIDDIYETKYEQAKKNEYFKINNEFGIDLSKLEDEAFPPHVIKAFHKLNDKCKMLIILKHVINLKHTEIVKSLQLFYPMKSDAVSRITLQRCIDKLVKSSVITP